MERKLALSPILVKELRSTMRGGRTFVGLTLFLLFLAGLSLLVYYGVTSSTTVSAQAGRTMFGFLSVIESLMLVTVAPPLTAGAIANERQKQTFDMLMATPLTPGQVLRGKLFASMTYLFLLMFASLPINAIVFLFGGVSPSSLLWWLALTVVMLLLLGAVGLLMSTLFGSSGVSTALTYLLCIIVFVILPIALIATAFVVTRGSQTGACFAASVALLHPAGSLAAIVTENSEFNPRTLLPGSLPLYGALAGLLFLGAEARLCALTARRWRGYRLLPVPLLVAAGAAGYILLVPTRTLCNLAF